MTTGTGSTQVHMPDAPAMERGAGSAPGWTGLVAALVGLAAGVALQRDRKSVV